MTDSTGTLQVELPRILYLETSSRCNSLCQTCILTFGGREEQRDLTWDEFRRVVDQFPKIDRTVLHGIGEPLLNRDLCKMIRHLKQRNSVVVFNSNAITLSEDLAFGLADAGLDEIRVSLDASTAGTYARVRGVDAFDKVIHNLKRLSELKQAKSLVSPKLSIWFTAMKDNIEEISGLVSVATQTGANGVYLQRLVYNGLGLAVESQSLHGRLTQRESELIRAVELEARDKGVDFSASGAASPEISLNPSRDGQPWSACRRPWTLVYVTVHGNVLPCCFAPWITQNYEGVILGNLYTDSLEKIWRGKRYQNFRAELQTSNPPEPCRGCGVKWSL